VVVGVEVAVCDDEAAEATEVGVVLGGGPHAAPTGGRGLGSISPRLMRGGIGAVGRTCRWRVSPAARSVRHRGQVGRSPGRSCISGSPSRSRSR
jgi:hypothetical protein